MAKRIWRECAIPMKSIVDEINRGRFVNLNIDLNIHGVGGIDTWGRRTLPQYTIDGNKPYRYAFILSWQNN